MVNKLTSCEEKVLRPIVDNMLMTSPVCFLNSGRKFAMATNVGRRIARPAVELDQDTVGLSSPQFAENYPQIFRFLSESRRTENFAKTGSLTVFWEDGVFKVCLNDRPNYRSCFVSHQELRVAFRIADRGLGSGGLKFRRKGYRGTDQPELFNRSGRYAE